MQTTAMDAVRVRVAGVDGYDRAGIAAVGAVADEIERLGLAATIVAGSSPEAVRMRVDGYAFGTMDAATPSRRSGTLGTVEQGDWSQLGAAARLGTQRLAGDARPARERWSPPRSRCSPSARCRAAARGAPEAATLRTVGWTRGRIMRWMLAEQVAAPWSPFCRRRLAALLWGR